MKNSTGTDDIELKELLKRIKSLLLLLLSKWYIIVSVALLFGCFGYYDGLVNKQTYKATLTFISENNSGDKLSSYTGIASQFGIDLGGTSGGGIFEGENLNEFFKSRYAIGATLLLPISNDSNTTLLDAYVKNHKLFKNANSSNVKNQFKNDSTTRRFDSLVNSVCNTILLSQLKVEKKDKKVGVVTIEFQDRDETFAKSFVEKLSDFVIDYYIKYRTKNAAKNLALLHNQSDSLRSLLNASIEGEAVNLDLNVNPLKQALKITSAKSRIDINANSTMYSEVLKQLAIAKISLMKETPLIQIIDSPIMPLVKVGFGKLMKFLIFFTIGFLLAIIFITVKYVVNKF